MKTLVRYLVYTLSAVAVISGEVEKQKCAARNYGENSVVCVCNSKYCDNIGTIAAPEPGSCLHFETNMAGLRLESQPCRISKGEGSGEPNISIAIINPSQTYQQILGFGGAITDSAGINIASLSSQAHSTLLSQYFGPQGIEYNFIRLPMGGSDFSIRYYTYDDVVNDARLSYFNLTYEDHRYKIPFVKQAIELSSRPVKLLTALWQVPIWMKEPRIGMHFPALGKLKENHYQLLADYMIRYLNSYKREGLEFWTLSPQNEPLSSFSFFWVPSTLTWTPKEQAEFLKNNLIPTLNSKGYGNLKLMLLDDVRPCINILLNEFKKHPEIMERAAALGVHWYMDDLFSPNVFSGIKRKFHNLPIISTEASILGGVRLGFWGNAERYVSDIIQDLNYEVAAWVDWNIALDTNGGPTYLSNYLDSPIIVNASADEFYKQPTFYAIAHFSKFVPPGSVRVNLKLDTHPQLQGIAFLTPEKTVTTVLTNRNSIPVKVELRVDEIGEVHIVLSPHSISTVVFGNYT